MTISKPENGPIGREIIVVQETGSTNDLVAQAGDDGAAEGLVIFAETQRAGRGRLGRVWESRPGLGLWFSVLLRPENVPAERWPELTFCAALAVALTAEDAVGLPAQIKWPNDVLLRGRKVAGILLENHQGQRGQGFIVMGIGINVLHAQDDFAPELRATATSLSLTAGSLVDRQTVATAVLTHLNAVYLQWPNHFASIQAACGLRG